MKSGTWVITEHSPAFFVTTVAAVFAINTLIALAFFQSDAAGLQAWACVITAILYLVTAIRLVSPHVNRPRHLWWAVPTAAGAALVAYGLQIGLLFWLNWPPDLLGWRTSPTEAAVDIVYQSAFVGVATAIVGGLLLLQTARRGRAVAPGLCPHCEYDLRGNRTASRCPECGNKIVGRHLPSPAAD